jgi:hypothetical protein
MTRRLTLGLASALAVGFLVAGGALHSPALHTLAAASTPPPAPTFVPTPIPPPPGPPTAIPTIAPAPSPTATTPPLGAPARIVASATVQRQGKTALLRWRMAYQLGIKGFRIYAGSTQLTRSLIHPHRSPNYSARVPWVKGDRYVLLVLFKNGHAQRLPVH